MNKGYAYETMLAGASVHVRGKPVKCNQSTPHHQNASGSIGIQNITALEGNFGR